MHLARRLMTRVTSPIVKPLLDTREYRHITLGTNKLEALLISDPAADKSAAALDVRVGSLFDPPQWQGLAHFTEHMLFLGTAKYPSEDEYQSYLAKHGGSSNAFTADNHTCYFFSISPDHLPGALDRFGQFFVDPLFTQSATDREVNAVHSEHSKNVQEDMWRQYQLMRELLFDPKHPAHHFSTGNKDTLSAVPREVLLNFHKAWYSANVCRVAVLGKESLDELEKMVTTIFSDVPNKDVVVPVGTGFSNEAFVTAIGDVVKPAAGVDTSKLSFPEIPEGSGTVQHVNPQCLNKQTFITPVKEQRSVQFGWFLPEQRTMWQTKPARYLLHILGHEGPGSLTSVLKAQGIATDLSGGLSYDCAGVALFKVDIHLTKPAAEKLASGQLLAELTETVAVYIRLATEQLSESLWKEVEVVDNLGFTFRAAVDPMTTVQTAANALHYYPADQVLAGPARIYAYDEAAIREHLQELTSSKMFVTCIGREFAEKCTQTEKWYGTKFGQVPIDPSILSKFTSVEKMSESEFQQLAKTMGLAMPAANPFLPTNLEVEPLGHPQSGPEQIQASPAVATFFKQDNLFRMPKANASFAIYSPFVQEGLANYVAADLFAQCLVEDHSQVAYQAEIAGLQFKLNGTKEGVSLFVGGYSDKIPVMVESVVAKLKSFTPSEQLFTLVKDRTVRKLQSQLMQKAPYSQAMDTVYQLILSPNYTTAEKLDQVQTTTITDLASVGSSLFQNAAIESLIEGNLVQSQAASLARTVVETVLGDSKSTPSQVGTAKVMKLSGDVTAVRHGVNPNETNGAVAVSVEAGWVAGHVDDSDETDLRTASLLNLASQICGQKFFDDLRTKQQLGYIVHAAATVQERRAGMLFLVQSELTTSEVKERMFEFINKLDHVIDEISDEDFGRYVEAVVTEYKEKPKNQTEEFQQHWSEIEKRRFDFQRRSRLIPQVEKLTKEDLVQFVRDHVVNGPKVIAIVTGSKDSEVAETLTNEEIKQMRDAAVWIESNSKPVKREATSKM